MKRRDLEAALEGVPDFPAPDAATEQYRTPPGVAAAFLWEAHQDGDIAGRDVLDLGCGTGILAHGAALLGAATVSGVDQDEAAVAVAREVVPTGRFEVADLVDWTPPSVDTVVMNPPFGSQRKGADRIFHRRAAQAVQARGGSVWFLQQPRNERFLQAFYGEQDLSVERIAVWQYPLEARFGFHSEALAGIEVAAYLAS